MQDYGKDNRELKPVAYSAAAIKRLQFNRGVNRVCMRIHWHERMELVRVYEGEMYMDDGINITKLQAGELFIIPPRVPHRAYTLDCEVSYDVLMFDVRSFYNNSEICNTYLPAIYDGRAKFQLVTSEPETIRCFDKISQSWEKNSLALIADIYRLLYLLTEHSLIKIQNDLGRDKAIAEIIQYMEENFSQDLSTASLSAHFGYTATHFGRKFKQATGLKPMTYLQIYRMETAYAMIKSGERNISMVAAQCGYSDANYFTRCFKSHFGFPPSQTKTKALRK